MVHKQKKLRNIFRTYSVKIIVIVKCNLKIVDYLDVTLNLSDGSYKPFSETEQRDHLIVVESRISKLSFDENVFIQAVSVYQEA